MIHGDAAPLVGRERELSEIEKAIADLLERSGGVVLVSGEPGIGKTRLAEEAAARAAAAGVTCGWGRCSDTGGAPAYWPWGTILRGLDVVVDTLTDTQSAILGVGPVSGAATPVQESDSEAARFRLFSEVAEVLVRCAREVPLLLVFDDLHSADRPALLLLEHVAREARQAPLLLLGTFRELEATTSRDRAAILGRVGRLGRNLPLGGLSRDDVRELVRGMAVPESSDDLTGRLHELTAGNPLFLEGLLRVVQRDGATALFDPFDTQTLPLGVREAIRHRLDVLPEGASRVLQCAAVAGTEFAVPVVAGAVGSPMLETLDVLVPADKAEVTHVASADGLRRRFSHPLLCEVLLEDLPPSTRATFHAGIAVALENGADGAPDAHLAEIAHHLERASDPERLDDAIGYGIRAGDRAMERLAFEGAAASFEAALRMMQRRRKSVDERERCELWIRLGEARWCAGESDASVSAYREAVALARSLEAPELLGRAVLGLGRHAVAFGAGAVDEELVRELEDALRAQPPEGNVALRAALLGRLAAARTFGFAAEEQRENEAREALRFARTAGDPATIGIVLSYVQWASWSPDNLDERRANVEQLLTISAEASSSRLQAQGRGWKLSQLLEGGELEAARRELGNWEQAVTRSREPYPLWQAAVGKSLFAFLDGDLERSEALATEALRIGDESGNANAVQLYGAQLLSIRGEQGRLDEMVEAVASFADQFPGNPVWRCALAWCLVELGRNDEARRELELLAVNDFDGIPRNMYWLAAIWLVAHAVVRLGDASRAEALHLKLLPYADRWMVVIIAAACQGSMRETLGLLAATAGRLDEAERFLDEALLDHARTPVLLARTKTGLADVLDARGAHADRSRAARLREEALATARALGLVALERGILSRETGAPRPTAAGERLPLSANRFVFRREGDTWAIGPEGGVFRLRDSKGLRYLAYLVERPGVEVHVLDLVALGTGGRPADAETGADPVLDERARVELRRKLEDLRSDLEEAERFGDLGRAAHARTEMEWIASELSKAVGLGGRARPAATAASQRARVAVTKAIKSALVKIAEQDASLAWSLGASVRTGIFCSYAPEPDSRVEWEL